MVRPARYFITNNRIVLSSEMGVLRVPEKLILKKDRLRPGKMLLVDLEKGKIIQDEDLKKEMYSKHNYGKIVKENILSLKEKVSRPKPNKKNLDLIKLRKNLFGYTEEDFKFLMKPMLETVLRQLDQWELTLQ